MLKVELSCAHEGHLRCQSLLLALHAVAETLLFVFCGVQARSVELAWQECDGLAALVLQETDRAVRQLVSLSREPIALSPVRCLISHRLARLEDPSPVLIQTSHRLARESLRVD